MNEVFDVLIVGAGHAGAQLAATLRQRRFAGSIAIVGDEPELPYERPPLSKDYLAGERPFERLLIRPPGFWTEREVAVLTARRVVAVDPAGHRVTTARGETFGYDRLVWAAGGAPRSLVCAGHDLRGVHAIRTRADVDRLRGELASADRVVVIGGGYIGLEAAAVLRGLGKAVTVLEAQDRVLARVAGAPLSDFFAAEHRSHGVELRLGVTVAGIVDCAGAAAGVRLADGSVVPADIVIVGIGIVPAVDPLLAAGAAVAGGAGGAGGGVYVDEYCRTTLPDVFAIGDCAAHANGFARGATIRLESVQNAHDQAATVAKLLTGAPEPYSAVPWFWSNQYDLKLQTVGLSAGHDVAIVRGDPAKRSFSVVYLNAGRVVALDCVNAVRDYVQGRALVIAGTCADPALLADATRPLKDLA